MSKGLELKIVTSDLKKVFKKWQDLPNRASLSRPEFRNTLKTKFEDVFAKDLQQRFLSSPPTTQGGQVYGGVYWRELSDSYLIKRPDRAMGQVLVDTQRLKNSFVVGSSDMISEFPNQNSYKFGSKVPHSVKLNKEWPIVFFHPKLLDDLAKTYVDWLLLDIKKRF